jgi:hypothetical protein
MVTGVAALVGTAVTLYAASNSRDDQLRKELSEIKAQIAGLDVRTNLQDRLSTLAGRLSRIEAAIKPVSPAAGSNPP